ncbi:MAG TPA: DUF4476 domain-containing protein, partial [Flavitalea sp.]|nr:DUF4476 domain-containing protein [Flavitalea sp.]
RGFELKKSSDGVLRLFDWQKASYIDPAVRPVKSSEGQTQAKTDSYSKLMAAVVDDPVVATITVPLPSSAPNTAENPPPFKITADTVALAATSTPGSQTKSENNVTAQKLDTVRPVKQDVAAAQVNSPAVVPVTAMAGIEARTSPTDTNKLAAATTASPQPGFDSTAGTAKQEKQVVAVSTISDSVQNNYRKMVFLDRNSNSTDTIDVVIQLEAEIAKSKDTSLYRVIESKADTVSKALPLPLINSDCKRFASDGDVDKLRVAILNANSNDTKVLEAKKIFKSRCFSTKQIRALSELFSSDDGRYKLFDAAYPFVSDSGNFKTLVDLLEDSFYVNRFKTLARIQD